MSYTATNPLFGLTLPIICQMYLDGAAKDRKDLAKHCHQQAERKAGQPAKARRWANTGEAMDTGDLDYIEARATGNWDAVNAKRAAAKPTAKAKPKAKAAAKPKASAPASTSSKQTVASLSKRMDAVEDGMAYMAGLLTEIRDNMK